MKNWPLFRIPPGPFSILYGPNILRPFWPWSRPLASVAILRIWCKIRREIFSCWSGAKIQISKSIFRWFLSHKPSTENFDRPMPSRVGKTWLRFNAILSRENINFWQSWRNPRKNGRWEDNSIWDEANSYYGTTNFFLSTKDQTMRHQRSQFCRYLI